ncbi:hypothetical protein NYE33_14800 [Paenibacillus sp. FSL R10-2199]|uniref:hypothetical protein n=1 Tax=Paenibacillus sp. FSL R10-2199 TaxID=2975348 RepID=UPI0030FD1025
MKDRHFDLFKQLYYDEIATRDRIWNMIMGYLTALPLLISAFVYFASKIKDIENDNARNWGYFLIIIIFIVLSISLYYFVRSLFGYEYHFLNSPQIIEAHTQSQIDYYGTAYNESYVKQATYENYRDFTHNNKILNERRQNSIIRAFRLLFIVFGLSSLLFVIYIAFSKEEIQRVEILNTLQERSVNMGDNNSNNNQTPPPSSPPPSILNEGNFSGGSKNDSKKESGNKD